MFEIKLAGENAIIIYFSGEINPELSQKIAFYSDQLQQQLEDLLIDKIPAYNSLLLYYRLDQIDHHDFCQRVNEVITNSEFVKQELSTEKIILPVYYNTDVGLDLERLLDEKKLSLEEFIQLHADQNYFVYAIGFSPAFAFLGEVDQRIQAPRLSTPRLKIPAGSVGIANQQTAIYPIDSSGGWNIIGRTPLDLSLNNPENLNRFKVGQQICFEAIDQKTYFNLGGQL